MPTIFRNSAADPTVRIFDSFYNIDTVVNANEFELVQAFFAGVCETKQQADQFTAFLFRVATESGIPAIELLSEMESMRTDSVRLNKFLIFYLNKFRPKTNLYGLSSIPSPVFPVARNVVR
jgi:hypothetical protein